MEFAGNNFIYLSKLKKEKINRIRKAEEDNKEEAPVPKIDKEEVIKKMEIDDKNDSVLSDDSDDAYQEVNSNNFNIDLVNSQMGNMNLNNNMNNMNMGMNMNMNMNMNNNMGMNQQAAPGLVFKKAIDTNVCVIRYKSLENPSKNLPQLYKCQKCEAYLNKYSVLIPKNNKFEWKCEFCSSINNDIIINGENMPKDEIIEKCVEPNIVKETNSGDESTLIFCFDISGSMCQSYNVGSNLKEKFNKILGKKSVKKSSLFGSSIEYQDDDKIDFSNYDFTQNNTNYISRLDMVKLSIEDNIKTLLKNSPNVKVGIVSFGSEIEVKGDCLSNVMIIKEKDMNNESKIKSLGEENTNLIKAKIKESSSKIIESIRKTEENGSTALGPAILMSLSLMKNAKIGSRIFLCTDGMSNLGVGDISENREKAIEFYVKIGNMAKEKGIVISLITFEDSESEIDVLKNMVELSGGEIIRVNPNQILDGFKDLLDNQAIATDVSIKLNLNKSMTFRDQDKKDLKNEESSIVKKLGNVTKETETYYELKFKHATKLAEMMDIDFNNLKNLIFQTEILYKNRNGDKCVRVITKNLKVSDNKEEINKQAHFNIVSTMQIQKSAKMAGAGNLMGAQAQIHLARNFLGSNQHYNMKNQNVFRQFNSNMNDFHMNLNSMNNNNFMPRTYNMNPNMNMNMMNNNMNMNMMNNDMNMMNKNMGMMNNNMNMNMMNNNMNMMNNMNRSNDLFSGQIFSLSNTSENRQNNMYNRSLDNNNLFK